MHQSKYATDMSQRFNTLSCNNALTPVETSFKVMKRDSNNPINPTLNKQMVGSLRYLCVTRLDIAYRVGLISRLMECLKQSHYLATKRILRYIKGTYDQRLLFTNNTRSNKAGIVGFKK